MVLLENTMNPEFYERTERMLGIDGVNRLRQAHIALFGIGGVGGHVAEALARAGVGRLTLVDADRVAPSNLNRQMVALHSTVGMPKVEAAQKRLLDISPDLQIETREVFFCEENKHEFDFARYDYVIDAIDSVSAKIALIMAAQATGTKIISCMGAGNKLDPTAFRVADIYKTSVCPLARVMRYELRRRGVKQLTVVYSEEPPLTSANRAGSPGSVSFVPGVAGMILAGTVIRELALG